VDQEQNSVSCPFTKDIEKYGFDITKADRIFDLLLQEGQIKLSPNHTIPSVEELKNRRYCKWHNALSYDTNGCKTFRQQIQSSIEQGRIKFKNPTKPIKIDGHPFPSANMVEINDPRNKGKADRSGRPQNANISRGIKESKLISPWAESFGEPRRTITSQMLLNKYQRRQDRERCLLTVLKSQIQPSTSALFHDK
jgi:hypothetical protein